MSDRFLLLLVLVALLVAMVAMPSFVKRSKIEGYREGYALTSLYYGCKGDLPHVSYINVIAPVLVKNKWRVDSLTCDHINLVQDSIGLSAKEIEKLLINRLGQKKPLFRTY